MEHVVKLFSQLNWQTSLVTTKHLSRQTWNTRTSRCWFRQPRSVSLETYLFTIVHNLRRLPRAWPLLISSYSVWTSAGSNLKSLSLVSLQSRMQMCTWTYFDVLLTVVEQIQIKNECPAWKCIAVPVRFSAGRPRHWTFPRRPSSATCLPTLCAFYMVTLALVWLVRPPSNLGCQLFWPAWPYVSLTTLDLNADVC